VRVGGAFCNSSASAPGGALAVRAAKLCTVAGESALRAAFEQVCGGKHSCSLSPSALLRGLSVTPSGCAGAVGLEVECSADNLLGTSGLIFICVVTFAVSATVTVKDFRSIDRRGLLIGMASQFGVMPLLTWLLAHAFGFENRVATGLVLIGCAPGGATSNLFTAWSGGNVALSIVMSCVSTLAATVMMPLCLLVYVQSSFTDEGLVIPYANIFMVLCFVLVSCGLGVLLRARNTTLKVCGRFLWQWTEICGGALGAAVLAFVAWIAFRDNPNTMNPREYPAEWMCSAMLQWLGAGVGWAIASRTGMKRYDRIAVSIETGVQNYSIVLAVVLASFEGCDRRDMLRIPLIAALWYVINATLLVTWFRFGPGAAAKESSAPAGSQQAKAGVTTLGGDSDASGDAGSGPVSAAVLPMHLEAVA
jgi:BASS family bile acid:Na+ symporter